MGQRFHVKQFLLKSIDVPGAEVKVRKDVWMTANPKRTDGMQVWRWVGWDNDSARAAATKDVELFIERVL